MYYIQVATFVEVEVVVSVIIRITNWTNINYQRIEHIYFCIPYLIGSSKNFRGATYSHLPDKKKYQY